MAKKVKPPVETYARIKVLGVGGAGSAAVNRMIEAGIKDLDFIVANTDAQDLSSSKAPVKINIGKETTRGLGAGSDPEIGQKAAEESIDEIKEAIKDTDMLFIALGAGGGTGSGAAHVIARTAKDMGILTVAFATRPFRFEGEKRSKNADFAISKLEECVDTLVLIPNDKLLEAIDRKTPLPEAFRIADDVLRQGVQGISDLITVPGMINLDFADVKAIMEESGQALMGIGRASGDDRAEVAARQAIESPLLDVAIDGARGVLFNVIGDKDMAMHEINMAASVITEAADQDVNVIFGATINSDLDGEIIVTVVATGFGVDYSRTRREAQLGVDQLGEVDTEDFMENEYERTVTPAPKKPRLSRRRSSKKEPVDDIDFDDMARNVDSGLSRKKKQSVIDDYDADWDEADETDELDKPTFLRKRKQKKERK